MAQLDSASVFGTEGYRFESCRAYFNFFSGDNLRAGTGCCYDNAVMERFFWSLKRAWTYHEQHADLEADRRSVIKYIEMSYNSERLHETLGYLSPNQFEADHAPTQAA